MKNVKSTRAMKKTSNVFFMIFKPFTTLMYFFWEVIEVPYFFSVTLDRLLQNSTIATAAPR